MDREHKAQTIPSMDIRVQVCPSGHVYLYVGHTCLFLQQDEFQDVAQMVHAVESYLLNEASDAFSASSP